ncbi:LysR family transcriptional regulator [Providencia rettgeri]|nr:LysR family transcriptional regulator [Providencia rettgeri]
MHFDITDLQLCVNIANTGSITGGASLTHLTLQSASERVRGLESELGTSLFIRSTRGVSLSNAGIAFIEHANDILRRIDLMKGEMRQYSQGLRGHINLLCNASAQMEFLPERIGTYLQQQSNMSISVKEMPSHEIVTTIKNKMANIGIVADSTDLLGLAFRPFCSDELIVLVHYHHPLAGQQHVTFNDLIHSDFIGLSEDNSLQKHIDNYAKQQGFRLNYRVRLPTFDTVMQLVANDVGIAIIPKQATQRILPSQTKILTLTEKWAQRKLVICARDFNQLPEYTNEFINFLINWQNKP